MKILLRLTAATILAVATGTAYAFPMTFTDVVNPEPNVLLNASNDSFGFHHDILDSSFNPLTDTIISATLLIDLGDDDGAGGDGTERASIYLDDLLVGSGHNPVNDFGYTFSSPFALIADGLLNGLVITIARPGDGSLGDFYFNASTLTVNVERAVTAPSAAIPEPGTVALLGIGLAGVGVLRRRARRS